MDPPTFLNLPGEIRNIIYGHIAFGIEDRNRTSQAIRLTSRQLKSEYDAQALRLMRCFLQRFSRRAYTRSRAHLIIPEPKHYFELSHIFLCFPLAHLLALERAPPDPIALSLAMYFLVTLPPMVHTVSLSFYDDVEDSLTNFVHPLGPAIFKVCHAVSLYFTKRDVRSENNTIQKVEVRWNEHLLDAHMHTMLLMVGTHNRYWEGEYFGVESVQGRHTMRNNGLVWTRKRKVEEQRAVTEE